MTDELLYAAGFLGMSVAIIHGYLGEYRIVRPTSTAKPGQKRIMHAIMFLSAVYWFAAGVLLLLTPIYVTDSSRPFVVYGVAAVFLSGSLGNLWALRGRHPGWVLLAVAAGLAVMGV